MVSFTALDSFVCYQCFEFRNSMSITRERGDGIKSVASLAWFVGITGASWGETSFPSDSVNL